MVLKRYKKYFDSFNEWRKKHKKLIRFILILVLIIIMAVDVGINEKNKPEEVKYSQFISDLNSGKIDTVYYSGSAEYMRYTLLNDETKEMTKKEREDYKYDKDEWRMTLYPATETFREDILKKGVNLVVKSFEPIAARLAGTVLTLLLPIFLIVFIIRMCMGNIVNDSVFEIDNSVKVQFKDVVGHDEIIKDLQFIVKLMQANNRQFNMEVPKGMLFTGEPGTGKTLLAKAIAGESNVPFLYMNASNFIELYVGTGAKRVRQLFKTARKMSPCIIFIDEIDAVGGSRGRNQNTSSEDTQTLTALLQEMDGFTSSSGIFVIAATNDSESLDKALLRAGRFDRQVIIAPPKDWKVRKEIFELYLRDVQHNVDLEGVSKQCAGFTGADINAIVNEAKLIASMREAEVISSEDIEEAIDKRIFKGNRSRRDEHDKETKLIAYHEAGHAVASYLLKKPIARVTIIGTTTGVGGFVLPEDSNEKFLTKTDLEHQIEICYAGRCSERIKFNEISIGAQNDITQATQVISQYVEKYGFNPQFGLLDLGYLNRGVSMTISSEKLLDLMSEMALDYEKRTEDLLRKNYHLVEKLAKVLLERETISGEALNEIFESLDESEEAEKEVKDNEENAEKPIEKS